MEVIPGHLERLPEGGDRVQAEMLSRDQRDRILVALAETVAKRGYQGTTVEHVVKRARISRATFYQHFKNREACLIGCFDDAAAHAARQIEEAAAVQKDWPAKVRAGLAAFLDFVVANPALARTCLVEVVTAGAAGTTRYESAMAAAAPALARGRELRRGEAELPESLEDSLVGGIVWMVHQRLLHNEADAVEGLLDTMVEFVLTPYLGERRARQLATVA